MLPKVAAKPQISRVSYAGWDDCLRFVHGGVELILATQVGIRILHAGFVGDENLFHLFEREKGTTGGGQWRAYGGHRLWYAPEDRRVTYQPDNDPVTVEELDGAIRLTQRAEPLSGVVKSLTISASAVHNNIHVLHELRNTSSVDLNISPWALTIMRPGGVALVPQEPFAAHDASTLLPRRGMALWAYTRMDDPRVTWGAKFIRIRQAQDPRGGWKLGVLNRTGWIAYGWRDCLFVKHTRVDPQRLYPDMNSSHEVYMDGRILELETLGPCEVLRANGGTQAHEETWGFYRVELAKHEDELERQLAPLTARVMTPEPSR